LNETFTLEELALQRYQLLSILVSQLKQSKEVMVCF